MILIDVYFGLVKVAGYLVVITIIHRICVGCAIITAYALSHANGNVLD